MRRPLTVMVTIFCGVLLGLIAARAALDLEVGFNRLRYGPWIGSSRLGGINADPYTKAALVRSGELPLGGGEGLTFFAERDSAGRQLSSQCSYRIEGEMPPSRYWTITASSKDGQLLENPARRHGFTSSEIVRSNDGRIIITASATPQAGNWLPLSGNQPLRLTLRLYDTPLANETGGVVPAWPNIDRRHCP